MKKTILFLMLAIMLFGIFAVNYTHRVLPGTRIAIEPVQQNLSMELLNQSARIMAKRLKAFSDLKFEMKLSPSHSQIEVTLGPGWNVPVAEHLLTQQGSLGFYETLNRSEFLNLFPSGNQILNKLDTVVSNSSPILGCVSDSEVQSINKELAERGFDQSCKLVWSPDHEKLAQCLYGLKWDADHQALLTGRDCDSVYTVADKSGNAELWIQFDARASKVWEEITRRNINRSVAIVMDNQVLATPVVRMAISGGSCSITGNFALTELKSLAALASFGELPTSFKLVK